MNIFVGNLAFSATDQALRQLFESVWCGGHGQHHYRP